MIHYSALSGLLSSGDLRCLHLLISASKPT